MSQTGDKQRDQTGASAAPSAPASHPANRLGLDYRAAPQRKVRGPIVDFHTHVNQADPARLFLEAARQYGIRKIVSMTPLPNAEAVRALAGDTIEFIAIPNWRREERDAGFIEEWLRNLAAFRELGARLCKFWMAPPLRGKHGITLEHPLVQPVIERALELGYNFMVHVGDPSVWWGPGKRYEDTARFGTKPEQYGQLRYLLRRVAPRWVVAAHMGGFVEDPSFLQGLLDEFPNLHLDTSATKWIVREVARRPDSVREFAIRNADRLLFGSDLVIDPKYDFDHYASRYWSHQMMWETGYRGESPIDDPDADNPPRLAGLDLPAGVLEKIYWGNAGRLGFAAPGAS